MMKTQLKLLVLIERRSKVTLSRRRRRPSLVVIRVNNKHQTAEAASMIKNTFILVFTTCVYGRYRRLNVDRVSCYCFYSESDIKGSANFRISTEELLQPR